MGPNYISPEFELPETGAKLGRAMLRAEFVHILNKKGWICGLMVSMGITPT